MTSIPTTAPKVARPRATIVTDAIKPLQRVALPAALLVLLVGLVVIAAVGESAATLPVDLRVVSTGDPMHLGATTQATVLLTNHGDHDLHPRFSLTWLPYPYYWHIDSGPEILRPGETATYEIEAPDAVAAPHDGERFQVRVNDPSDITYAASSPFQNGRSILPIVNPNLLMWSQQDPSSGLIGPAGWTIYRNVDGEDEATLDRQTMFGVDAAHLHVTQRGPHEPGHWTHTGIAEDIPFPTAPLDVRVLSRVSYQSVANGWLLTAFGLEVTSTKHESTWILFERTGSGNRAYDLPNGQHIEVYDVPPDQWTTVTVDLMDLYRRMHWAPPRRVLLKAFIGASSSTKADIDGYIASIGLHQDAGAQAAPGG